MVVDIPGGDWLLEPDDVWSRGSFAETLLLDLIEILLHTGHLFYELLVVLRQQSNLGDELLLGIVGFLEQLEDLVDLLLLVVDWSLLGISLDGFDALYCSGTAASLWSGSAASLGSATVYRAGLGFTLQFSGVGELLAHIKFLHALNRCGGLNYKDIYSNPSGFWGFGVQEAVIDQVSLVEDRIHKLLGVKFKEIISASNFNKSI